ncbi:hypothetical protein [Streptomyces sp. NPDC054838]
MSVAAATGVPGRQQGTASGIASDGISTTFFVVPDGIALTFLVALRRCPAPPVPAPAPVPGQSRRCWARPGPGWAVPARERQAR